MTTDLLLQDRGASTSSPSTGAPAAPIRLIERLLPVSDVAKRHEIRVAAPAAVTWVAAANLRLQRSWVVWLLLASRAMPGLPGA